MQDLNVEAIIKSQDMEQLAALVLNGDGQKLIGLTAPQPEIQAFLDNVPAYMVISLNARKHLCCSNFLKYIKNICCFCRIKFVAFI